MTWPMPSKPASSEIASLRPDLWPGGRSVCVGSPVTIMRDPSPRRVRNIFICIVVGILRFVQQDAGVGQRAPAHEGERRDLDHAGLHAALDHARVHEILQRVVDRAQIGIDLLAHVAGQKAEPLAGLDRGARQDQPLDDALFEQRNGMADRQPGLAGAGRPFGEDEFVLLQRAQIEILGPLRARTRRCLRVRDLFEDGARRRRASLGKKRALQRAFLDARRRRRRASIGLARSGAFVRCSSTRRA